MIKERADDALISCILKKEKMPAGGWVSAGGRQFRNLKIHNRIKSNFNPSEPEDFHPQFLIGDEDQIAPQKSSDRIGSLLIRIADILPETVFSVLGFSCGCRICLCSPRRTPTVLIDLLSCISPFLSITHFLYKSLNIIFAGYVHRFGGSYKGRLCFSDGRSGGVADNDLPILILEEQDFVT